MEGANKTPSIHIALEKQKRMGRNEKEDIPKPINAKNKNHPMGCINKIANYICTTHKNTSNKKIQNGKIRI